MEQSTITIKSNITLNIRGVVPPMDNMHTEYFDTRLGEKLSEEQRKQKDKMLYWAEKVYDENNNEVKDECYKGCENCGEMHNHCKRLPNKRKQV